jgi:hypothetical protein
MRITSYALVRSEILKYQNLYVTPFTEEEQKHVDLAKELEGDINLDQKFDVLFWNML